MYEVWNDLLCPKDDERCICKSGSTFELLGSSKGSPLEDDLRVARVENDEEGPHLALYVLSKIQKPSKTREQQDKESTSKPTKVSQWKSSLFFPKRPSAKQEWYMML